MSPAIKLLFSQARLFSKMPARRSSQNTSLEKDSVRHLVKYRFIFFSLLFWLILISYVSLVPPVNIFTQINFFIILFFVFFSTAYAFGQKLKISLLAAFYLTTILIFSLLKLLSPLNITLLSGFTIALHFLLFS